MAVLTNIDSPDWLLGIVKDICKQCNLAVTSTKRDNVYNALTGGDFDTVIVTWPFNIKDFLRNLKGRLGNTGRKAFFVGDINDKPVCEQFGIRFIDSALDRKVLAEYLRANLSATAKTISQANIAITIGDMTIEGLSMVRPGWTTPIRLTELQVTILQTLAGQNGTIILLGELTELCCTAMGRPVVAATVKDAVYKLVHQKDCEMISGNGTGRPAGYKINI